MIEVKKTNWRLKLDENENVYGCFDSVLNIIKNITQEDISKYPNNEKLIDKISEKFEINKNNILLTTSSNRAIKDLKEIYLAKDENIIYHQPFQTISSLKGKISQNTKIVQISTPNHITGEVFKASLIETLIKEYPEILFIIECDYINFSYKVAFEDYFNLLKYENVAIVKDFSKDYALAGLKIGFIIANEKIIIELLKTNINDVSSLAINCALISLNENKRQEEIKELNQNTKSFFEKEMQLRGFETFQSEANFILCNFENYCKFYFEKLVKNDVLTKNFFEIPALSNFLRITIPTLGGAKFFLELLSKKDVLIFDSIDIFLNDDKLAISIEKIEELSKNYDLILQTENYSNTIAYLEKLEIDRHFYLQEDEEIASILNCIPYKKALYFSADINNIIKANMSQIETIGVLKPNANFQNMINNFKHVGVNHILDDINELTSLLAYG